jgi:hypothetical protein
MPNAVAAPHPPGAPFAFYPFDAAAASIDLLADRVDQVRHDANTIPATLNSVQS